ncbi:hypothetical protein [Pseudomonas aegrilactucae]|uniref:Uncharacterized protein n=1 Tax=Pseudomonas aegrilactucae TaxID=2854028 RepID=A0A9Q2XQD4_9PSED|nr:hypothetical protein [Pseudomonas aegrilactucae]MBV6290259.1 hypothetical protein [Pseudomonas aegrilactucae]
MHPLPLVAVVLLLSQLTACSLFIPRAKATVEPISLQKQLDGRHSVYTLTFAADVDVLDAFRGKTSQLGTRIECSITEDENLAYDHRMAYSLIGEIVRDDSPPRDGLFISTLSFQKKDQYRGLSDEAALDMLKRKPVLPCTMKAAGFFVGYYYSRPFTLQASDLIRLIKGPVPSQRVFLKRY